MAELLAAVNEHRRFAHFVDRRTIASGPSLAVEKIDKDRLPVGAEEVEHQRRAVSVAGLGETVELIFGHSILPAGQRESESAPPPV